LFCLFLHTLASFFLNRVPYVFRQKMRTIFPVSAMPHLVFSFCRQRVPALICALAALGLSGAQANSFSAPGKDASGLGVAYAGTSAYADNASVQAYNPAGINALGQGLHFSAGALGIKNRVEFSNRGSSDLSGGNGGDAGDWQTLPNLYLAWRITEGLGLGFAVTSPETYDLAYDRDWLGRGWVTRARLGTTSFAPSLALSVFDSISLGLGLEYETARLTVENAGGKARDSDHALGWHVGALFTLSERMRVGASYHSGKQYTLDAPSGLSAFPGVSDSGRFRTPEVYSLSVWQRLSEEWEALGDFSYTRWSDLKDYSSDSWRFSWGAIYTHNERWKSKFGIAYDRSPNPRRARALLIPDAHRLLFSLGGQYRLSKTAFIDFGYAYQWSKRARLDHAFGGARLRGVYDVGGHLLGVQYSQGF
jgi:long-chain fatty acid transport protein